MSRHKHPLCRRTLTLELVEDEILKESHLGCGPGGLAAQLHSPRPSQVSRREPQPHGDSLLARCSRRLRTRSRARAARTSSGGGAVAWAALFDAAGLEQPDLEVALLVGVRDDDGGASAVGGGGRVCARRISGGAVWLAIRGVAATGGAMWRSGVGAHSPTPQLMPAAAYTLSAAHEAGPRP